MKGSLIKPVHYSTGDIHRIERSDEYLTHVQVPEEYYLLWVIIIACLIRKLRFFSLESHEEIFMKKNMSNTIG